MATRLEIERDKLKLVDTITDQVLAECASECTKIIQVIPLDDTYLVREDPEGFPVDRSNVYLLDSNLNRCWTAELPVPGDVYTEIRSFTGRIWAASRAGHFCTLSQATGVIFKRDWSRPVTSIQVTDLYHDLLRWKGFFDVAGGSILYCLSAMLILFGIVKIMGPILATQFDLTAILPPLVVMNVYELVLLGILIFVVVRLKIMDDAISLVILICLFLMANGITLDTVAIAGPKTVLYIGIACTILGLIKLEIIKRYIIPQLDRWFLAAGAVLMVWNFMAGPIIARHKMYMDSLHAFKREPWLWAWYAVLAAAVLAVVGATSAVCRTDEKNEKAPFLHTTLMSQLFMLLMLAAAGTHQYAMAYQFRLDYYSFGDLLPLICVGSLFVMEIFRAAGKRFVTAQIAAGCAGLVAVMIGIFSETITARGGWGHEILWYPPILLGLTGLGIAWLALHHRRPWLWYVVLVYAFGVTLTVGYSPDHPDRLNWFLAGALAAGVVFALGVWQRKAALCLSGIFIALIGLGTTDTFKTWTELLEVNRGLGVLGLMGLATLLLHLFFPEQIGKLATVCAALLVMMCLIDLVPEPIGWYDFPTAVGIVGLCTAVNLRTRHWETLPPLLIPLFWRIYLYAMVLSNWGYVVLSFAVLASGVWLSIRKSRKRSTA